MPLASRQTRPCIRPTAIASQAEKLLLILVPQAEYLDDRLIDDGHGMYPTQYLATAELPALLITPGRTVVLQIPEELDTKGQPAADLPDRGHHPLERQIMLKVLGQYKRQAWQPIIVGA